jgi:hypothetical protein
LGQKGDLFQLKLSITQPSLENFEQPEDHCFQFSKLWQSIYWKKIWIIGKRASTSRPTCTAWSGATLKWTCVERSSIMPAFTVLCVLPLSSLPARLGFHQSQDIFPILHPAVHRSMLLVHQTLSTGAVPPPSGASLASNVALSSGPECRALCFSPLG